MCADTYIKYIHILIGTEGGSCFRRKFLGKSGAALAQAVQGGGGVSMRGGVQERGQHGTEGCG